MNGTYAIITENFKANTPILYGEIESRCIGISRQAIKRLVDDGQLRRYDKGIYYIPKKFAGTDIEMEPLIYDVLEKKYILEHGRTVGFYGGNNALAGIGITSQVSGTIEIISNKATAPVRKVNIKGNNIIVRKPVATITEENAAILRFMDMVWNIGRWAEDTGVGLGKKLRKYIDENGIKTGDIKKYAEMYPAGIYKNLYIGGFIDYV